MTEIDYRRLIIFGVDRDMTDGELAAEFNKFGRVINVHNSLRGFAFVSFQNKDSADLARRKMDQTTMNHSSMNGGRITVQFAKRSIASDSDSEGGESESESRGGSGGKRRLYIYGVDRDMTEGDLTAHFEKFGRVTKVYITDKGCAFVSFQNEETANMAMRELDQTIMNGRRITVEIAKSKEEISDSVRLLGGIGGEEDSSSSSSPEDISMEEILDVSSASEENRENIVEERDEMRKERVIRKRFFGSETLEIIEELFEWDWGVRDQAMAWSKLEWFQWIQSR